MQCPKCKAETSGKFCDECGAKMPESKLCPQCGTELLKSKNFCSECGYNFNAKNEAVTQNGGTVGDFVATRSNVHIDQSQKIYQGDDPNARKQVTKEGERCPICGGLVKEDFFYCFSCERDFIHNKHQKNSPEYYKKHRYICEECFEQLEYKHQKEQERFHAEKREEEKRRKQEAARRKLEAAGVVFVEGGEFEMGDTFGDGSDDEKPVHTVKIDSFYMGKYQVTFEQYAKFCEAAGKEKPDDEGWGRGKRPVINISWYNAVAYCNWLSEQEGLEPCYKIAGKDTACDFSVNGYRLPTEAEWEYAARGGNQSQGYKYAGSDNLAEVGWYGDNSGGKTHPVGEKKPNELELYDMSGNVWEWCWDWYDEEYYKNSPAGNPKGPSGGSYRVDRGGSWGGHALNCRVAGRGHSIPSYGGSILGFRLVRLP